MLNWTFQTGQRIWTAPFCDLTWLVTHEAMQQKAEFLGVALEPTLENTEWLIRQLQNPEIWLQSEITYL